MAVSDAILTRLLVASSEDHRSQARPHVAHPATGSASRRSAVPPVIHVAGTNGKGSTVAYLQSHHGGGRALGPCYTSPHLVKFHERIRLGRPGNGALIAENELIALLEECEAANGGEPITFFEITTAAAFLAFARNPADYLLLEVGLGGRLDATNVIAQPLASVITTVDYDHQHYLGNTLPPSPREKAGILKDGVPCIVAPQPEQALDEIIAEARRRAVPT